MLVPILLACPQQPVTVEAREARPARPANEPGVWTFSDEPTKASPVTLAAAAPLQLTASDGTGLGIVSLTANAVIDGPLAFTELRMVFDNPRAQQIEGQFRITLPERASVSRFAMMTNGAWQEGEVVERQAARRAYEDFLHRRQDPALLEQQAGNEFSARIFPIPPRGQKEVVIAYSEELLSEPFRIALSGLPRVGALDVRAHSGGVVKEMHVRDFTPEADFVVDDKRDSGIALRRDNLLVARIQPVTEVEVDTTDSLMLLIDTSASRTLGKAADLALAKDLVGRLKDAPVAVWAFDQTTLLVGEGKASDIDWSKLEQRRSLGASNLEQALTAIAKHEKRYRRGLLISDGVVTAGIDALGDAVKATGVQRFDAIAVGGIRDRSALQRLVMGGGLVVDGGLSTRRIADKLNHKTRSGIKVAIPGAAWVWPETLDGVQPGDQVLIYADLPADHQLAMTLDGKSVAAGTMRSTPRPLLERAWVAARIKRLLDQTERTSDRDVRDALTRQVIELSTTHRVLCPLTALLVLETEQDYARFHIDRKALAGILAIENGSVVVTSRKSAVVAKSGRPVEKPKLADTNAPPHGTPAEPRSEDKGAPRMPRATSGRVEHERHNDAIADTREDLEAKRSAPVAARPSADSPPSAGAEARSAAPSGLGSGGAVARPSEIAPAPSNVAAPSPPPVVAKTETISPYTGQFRAIMTSIRRKENDQALTQADAWWQGSPGDVMALVALGEALEANDDAVEAGRAYGSLIDLFPARADMRRFAGQRLERLKGAEALALALDTYAKAVEQRPDHPQSHRLLAYALLKQGQPERAFDVLANGARQNYPAGRFAGVAQILSEDLGIAAEAMLKVSPDRKDDVYQRLTKAGGRRENAPSLRFILSWETDANDVDFHIFDGTGGHAFYSDKELPSGGELYEDVTTGYGPECFTIRGKPRGYPYKLQAHYYSRGPMGYGMGKLQIVQHDGHGNLKFDERPFVVMQDQAFLELGMVKRSL